LRERPADIAPLARRFLTMRASRDCRLSTAALAALANHDWPGNARELENVIQRALVLAGGAATIEPQHLVLGSSGRGGSCGSGGTKTGSAAAANAAAAALPGLADELWEEEARRIVTALRAHHGGRKRAAQQLGISDRTLRYKLAKMRAAGIDVPGDRAVGAGA
jgi:two-component system response regulator FlrC